MGGAVRTTINQQNQSCRLYLQDRHCEPWEGTSNAASSKVCACVCVGGHTHTRLFKASYWREHLLLAYDVPKCHQKRPHYMAKYFMIVCDHHGQPQTEVSTDLRTICHPSGTKNPTCFLLQKQSRHAEATGKENSAEVLLVSSLTTAVFFSWSSLYSCDNCSKIFARPPSCSQPSL